MTAKLNFLGLLLAGCGILMLSSCEKEVYDSSKAKKTTDLVVPEGFDWALTRSVDISMQSKNGTYASFYLDKDCKDLVAEMPVQAGNSSTNLELPTASTKIWVKYPAGEGKEEVKEIAVKQKADTRAGDAGRWTADALFPDYPDNNSSHVNQDWTTYQPSKEGFGTIMFEDMWPDLGDYDFNDYVINYNIKAWLDVTHEDMNNVYVTMTLKLRAMGGSKPYKFCVRVGKKSNTTASMNLKKEEITLLSSEIKPNPVEASVTKLENTEDAIIALEGFEKLKGSQGGSFYNTEKGRLVSNEETPIITINFKVTRQGQATKLIKGFGAAFAFDYFLQNTNNNREIHFIDYPPTSMYTDYEKDRIGDNTTFYCSDKRFVWALKAPVEMGWSVELTDIKYVYEDFPKWVESGGNMLEGNSNWDSNNQWYNRPNTNENIYIDCKKH